MPLKPSKHEDLVNFDADKLHKDHLVDLDTVRVTILNQFATEADLILDTNNDGVAENKRQDLLQCLTKDLFMLTASLEQVCLKLLAPVFDEVDSTLLS